MIYPVGRHLGSIANGDHEVLRAGAARVLDPDTFRVWACAHGSVDPIVASALEWNRTELERYAKAAGVDDPSSAARTLLDDGLLVTVPVGDEDELVRFADQHVLVPLAVGLGNLPDDPDRYVIGMPGHAVIAVDRQCYELWSRSQCHRTLWEVCGAGSDDPLATLKHFLARLRPMLGANVACIDRVAS